MHNAKLSILATIGLVGLSILAGCQKPAKAPSMANEGKAPPPAAKAPPGTRWLAVELHNNAPTSTPDPVILALGDQAPHHPPDRIVWVSMDDSLEVCFSASNGSPFEDGSPKPHAPPVPGAKVFVVPKGEAVPSGPLKKYAPDGPIQAGQRYPFVVTSPMETCPPDPMPPDGIVIIKH